jgi:hypothetical protein
MELAIRGLERLLDALNRFYAVKRLENSRVEMAYVADAADYRLQRAARDVRLNVLRLEQREESVDLAFGGFFLQYDYQLELSFQKLKIVPIEACDVICIVRQDASR